MHIENKETKLQKEIQQLKTEILHLKAKNLELEKKINDISKVQIPTNVETNEKDETSENILKKQTDEISEISQDPAINLNEDKSLYDLIRENSWFSCDVCDFKSKSKKGLRIHTVKSHSVGSVNDNYKVLVKFGGGMREDKR